MAVCRGDAQADVVFENANIVNVFTRTTQLVSLSLFRGRFAHVGSGTIDAKQTVDLNGRYVAPGLIDAHMHVESTMMMPKEFARVASAHGTTGVIFDPHEIANVLGIAGIRLIMDASEGLPMNIRFAASSCVPSSAFETSGASLSAEDLRPLFDDERVVALAEMMNFPGVYLGDDEVLSKIQLGLDRAIVDGHAPGLGGRDLSAYIAAGISSDHECTSAKEALEKVERGMRIYIREGSAARNLEALIPAVNEKNASRFCFCTDDRHPGDLKEQGHIDHVIRKAISLGLDPITAIAMGSLHVAEHYRLNDLGAIAPGKQADMIIFDDLQSFELDEVYWRGQLIAQNGIALDAPFTDLKKPDDSFSRGSVHLPKSFSVESLRLPAKPGVEKIRVIEADPFQLLTQEQHVSPCIDDGHYVADPTRDLLLFAVLARHGTSDGIGLGFVKGFGMTKGAIGSTVGHDAHNLALLGTNEKDMFLAAKTLEKAGGGQCVVLDGQVIALLALPIAGLISDQSAEVVIEQQCKLLEAAKQTGTKIEDPFMPLSFLSLPVIPSLKLTDRGLIDVNKQCIVPLEV